MIDACVSLSLSLSLSLPLSLSVTVCVRVHVLLCACEFVPDSYSICKRKIRSSPTTAVLLLYYCFTYALLQVWSAASASCALPGLYESVQLMARNDVGMK